MAVKLLILVTGEGSLFLEQTGARYAAGQSEVLTLFADLNPFAAGFIKSQLSPISESQVRRIRLNKLTPGEAGQVFREHGGLASAHRQSRGQSRRASRGRSLGPNCPARLLF